MNVNVRLNNAVAASEPPGGKAAGPTLAKAGPGEATYMFWRLLKGLGSHGWHMGGIWVASG